MTRILRSGTRHQAVTVDRDPTTPFVWNPRQWIDKTTITGIVRVMVNKSDNTLLVIRKTLEDSSSTTGDHRALEIKALDKIPKCNRIVQYLHYQPGDGPLHPPVATFPFYSFGDLAAWKEREFDNKNYKRVPESFIWRLLVQMSQALAVMQGAVHPQGDVTGKWERVLHRDIKPKNILVVNHGTTYPSFKLHDFGCAKVYSDKFARQESLCGTFEWQPPENPRINTFAAEIWALGACVHFLATGRAPIQNRNEWSAYHLKHERPSPFMVRVYGSYNKYVAARVPRQVVSITEAEVQQTRRDPLAGNVQRLVKMGYSNELDEWMKRCLSVDPVDRPSAMQLLETMVPTAKEKLKKLGGSAALADLELTWTA